MEKKKRKPLHELYESMKELRKRPPNPAAVDKFNDLMRKDEQLEKAEKAKGDSERKKIARDPEVGA
ncbi:MAG: hypothetical protein RJB38_1333 [Pseudomonadota bacterium]|jgi:hypothetical protein